MNSYPVDTLVQVNGNFLSVTAPVTPEDPSTVTLTVIAPDETEQTYTTSTTPAVVRVSTGVYYVQFQITEFGIYIYRWQGLGAVIAASPNGFLQGI